MQVYLAQDILVMKDAEHPEWLWGTSISEVDGKYLFLDIVQDTGKVCARCLFIPYQSTQLCWAQKNLLWVTNLQENEIGQNMKWEKIVNEFESEYTVSVVVICLMEIT